MNHRIASLFNRYNNEIKFNRLTQTFVNLLQAKKVSLLDIHEAWALAIYITRKRDIIQEFQKGKDQIKSSHSSQPAADNKKTSDSSTSHEPSQEP